MLRVHAAVRQAGPTLESVLVVGEPGTGKEHIARALHAASGRAAGPFIKVECRGYSPQALDRILFGTARGENTGPGLIERADGGTLYLCDVDALELTAQAALLEVLREGSVSRLGSDTPHPVNVRLIASCESPLAAFVSAGRFSVELERHLSSVLIETPALRNRREDIPAALAQALARANAAHGRAVRGFAAEAVAILCGYPWPGNLGELENTVEGMVLLCGQDGMIGLGQIPQHIRTASTPSGGEIRMPVGATMREIERAAILETLRANGYNKERSAQTLGIGLRTLYRKLRNYGIG
jgi:two-component system response regulator HydG